MSLPVYELDGRRFLNFAEFATHFSEVVLIDHQWKGNLEAFNDILRGGFRTPEGGFVLRIVHAADARRALGYAETASWFKTHAQTCHPTNAAHMLQRMREARAGRGDTLFDMIVEIIRAHGEGGCESEDNIVLEIVKD